VRLGPLRAGIACLLIAIVGFAIAFFNSDALMPVVDPSGEMAPQELRRAIRHEQLALAGALCVPVFGLAALILFFLAFTGPVEMVDESEPPGGTRRD